jgi:hypothetical protein
MCHCRIGSTLSNCRDEPRQPLQAVSRALDDPSASRAVSAQRGKVVLTHVPCHSRQPHVSAIVGSIAAQSVKARSEEQSRASIGTTSGSCKMVLQTVHQPVAPALACFANTLAVLNWRVGATSEPRWGLLHRIGMVPTEIKRCKHSAILWPSGDASVPKLCLVELISLALLLFSASASAQTSNGAPGRSTEPVYSVVSPIGESTVKLISMTPRPNTLAGKTACMVSNRSFKADIVLPAIADQLKQRYPDIKIVSHREMPIAPLPTTPDNPQQDAETLRAALKAKGCSVVVTGDGG